MALTFTIDGQSSIPSKKAFPGHDPGIIRAFPTPVVASIPPPGMWRLGIATLQGGAGTLGHELTGEIVRASVVRRAPRSSGEVAAKARDLPGP